MSIDQLFVLAVPATAGLLLTVLCVAMGGNVTFVRRVVWVLVLFPAAFLHTSRTAVEVQSSGLGITEALRAAIPAFALILLVASTRPLRRWAGWPEIFLTAFGIWILLTAVWSMSPRETVLKGIVQIIHYALLLVLARRYRDSTEVLRGIVAVSHFLMLSTVAGLIVAPGLALGRPAEGIGRLTGVFPPISHNILGLLAVIAILALLVGFGPAWTLRRDVRVGLLALYSVEALLAQSRLALVVGIAIALFPLLRVAQRSIIGTFVLLAGAAVAAGLLLAKSDALFGFFVRGQSIYELTTLTGRTVLWERALDLWATRPWTGLGYYSGHRFGIEFIPGPVEQSTLDNVWVETLLDVGISGTILLATFLALATVRMLRAARALPSSTALLMYGVAALAIFSTFFSPSIQGTNLASVVFILFFLAFQSSPTPGNKVTIPARKLRITARPFGAIQPPHHQTSTHHFSTPSPSPTRCSPSSTRATPRDDEARGFADLPPARGGTNQCK